MNENYSIKELIHDKEDLELEIYKLLRDFQIKYDCNIDVEIIQNEEVNKAIKDVLVHIGV